MRSSKSHKSHRPLTVLAMRLVVQSYGTLDAFPFHLLNLILHMANSTLTLVLVDILIYSITTKRNQISTRRLDGLISGGACMRPVSKCAFITAIFFTLHPVHTETVSACVGIADLLCCFFLLLALISYMLLLLTDEMTSRIVTWIIYSSALVCCVMSKEQGYVLPVLCIAFDTMFLLFHRGHDTPVGHLRPAKSQDLTGEKLTYTEEKPPEKKKNLDLKPINNFVLRCAVLLSFQVSLFAMRYTLMGGRLPSVFRPHDNPAEFIPDFHLRLLNRIYIWMWNIWLLMCPNLLCFDWSMGCIDLIGSIYDVRALIVLIMGGLGFWSLIRLRTNSNTNCYRWFLVLFCLLFGSISFIPASNLLFTVGFTLAERQLYIPSIPFCLLTVLAMDYMHHILSQYKMPNQVLPTLYTFIVAVYAVKSSMRCKEWNNEHLLYQSALKPWYNLAVMNQETNANLSLALYLKGEQLHPDYPELLNNLGNLLYKQGYLEEAVEKLSHAVASEPKFATAWMNYGVALADIGSDKEAQLAYNTAVSLRPTYPDCYFNMARLLKRMGRKKESEKAVEVCLKQDPTHVQCWIQYIHMAESTQHVRNSSEKEVVARINRALLAVPKSHELLALKAYMFKNYSYSLEESKQLYMEAIAINPRVQVYYANLGVVCQKLKDYDNALISYNRALELDPNDLQTKRNLSKLKKTLKLQGIS
ncbi:protein O-mannosyl-transferase TMTC4-like isoform X2 [Convolutriloba macropyga]|uniref:protein O-mannosyl-transferase TMTC4-like isoform X2 n=1 Tax=Convolutriloba macropyga TaxID=536237 RepID=UPI003F51F3C4